MSAKKAAKAKAPTPPRKRARSPRARASLPGGPPAQPAPGPTAEATPDQGAAGVATPEPDSAEPAPEAVIEGLAADAVLADGAGPGAAAPTEGALPDPAAQGVTGPSADESPTDAARPAVGESPAAQAATEPPAIAGAEAQATAEGTTPEAPGQRKKGRKPRATKAKGGGDGGQAQKFSALDAAAQVLAEAGRAMTCPEMIAAMAAAGYWSSPAGRTPQATLYSALAREITQKGEQARFRKAGRGLFALAAAA